MAQQTNGECTAQENRVIEMEIKRNLLHFNIVVQAHGGVRFNAKSASIPSWVIHRSVRESKIVSTDLLDFMEGTERMTTELTLDLEGVD